MALELESHSRLQRDMALSGHWNNTPTREVALSATQR